MISPITLCWVRSEYELITSDLSDISIRLSESENFTESDPTHEEMIDEPDQTSNNYDQYMNIFKLI